MIDPVAWHKFLDHKSQVLIYINLWSIPNSFLTTKITMCYQQRQGSVCGVFLMAQSYHYTL